jgi:hypothetical protein
MFEFYLREIFFNGNFSMILKFFVAFFFVMKNTMCPTEQIRFISKKIFTMHFSSANILHP